MHGKYEANLFPQGFRQIDNVFISLGALDPTPDRSIVKRLRDYDPGLNVEWDRIQEKWIVTGPNLRQFGKRERVMTVQNEDRSYRPLDDRIVTLIILADSERHGDVKTFIRTMEQNERHLSMKQQRAYSEKLRYMAKGDLYNSYFGSNARGSGFDFGGS